MITTRIEALSDVHAPGLFAALSPADIYTWLDDGPPDSVKAVRARIARLAVGGPPDGSERWLNWAVVERDRVVGYVQATLRRDASASIAYVLTPDVWGQGVAERAVRLMLADLAGAHAVRRFHADTEAANQPSQRLLRRLGFVEVDRRLGDVVYARPA